MRYEVPDVHNLDVDMFASWVFVYLFMSQSYFQIKTPSSSKQEIYKSLNKYIYRSII